MAMRKEERNKDLHKAMNMSIILEESSSTLNCSSDFDHDSSSAFTKGTNSTSSINSASLTSLEDSISEPRRRKGRKNYTRAPQASPLMQRLWSSHENKPLLTSKTKESTGSLARDHSKKKTKTVSTKSRRKQRREDPADESSSTFSVVSTGSSTRAEC